MRRRAEGGEGGELPLVIRERLSESSGSADRLLAELVGQLGDIVGDNLLNLGDMLVGHNFLTDLLVDSILCLVEALLNDALDIEAHGDPFLRSRALGFTRQPRVRGIPPQPAKRSVMLRMQCLSRGACGGFTASPRGVVTLRAPPHDVKLYGSYIASVDKCTYPRGHKKPPRVPRSDFLSEEGAVTACPEVFSGVKIMKLAGNFKL